MRTPLLRPIRVDGRVVLTRRKRDGVLVNVDTDFALPSRITVLSADMDGALPVTLSLCVPRRRAPDSSGAAQRARASPGQRGFLSEDERILLDDWGAMQLELKRMRELCEARHDELNLHPGHHDALTRFGEAAVARLASVVPGGDALARPGAAGELAAAFAECERLVAPLSVAAAEARWFEASALVAKHNLLFETMLDKMLADSSVLRDLFELADSSEGRAMALTYADARDFLDECGLILDEARARPRRARARENALSRFARVRNVPSLSDSVAPPAPATGRTRPRRSRA